MMLLLFFRYAIPSTFVTQNNIAWTCHPLQILLGVVTRSPVRPSVFSEASSDSESDEEVGSAARAGKDDKKLQETQTEMGNLKHIQRLAMSQN